MKIPTTGIDAIVRDAAAWFRRGRVGLLGHPASVTALGVPSAQALLDAGVRLTALFGPEHGFLGGGGAGESITDGRHPAWDIPVYSLYGKHRKPTLRMVRNVDTILCDLQDLGARPYTYVATLRYMLEMASRAGIPVVVADRPVPLPCRPDGPLLEPAHESFVASIPAPMMYAMTPGETALWMNDVLGIRATIRVSRLRAPPRHYWRYPGWAQWIPPSPGIPCWETAMAYTALVFGEATPAVDIGRGTPLPFRVFGMARMETRNVLHRLNRHSLPGVAFFRHVYRAARPPHEGRVMDGIRIHVTDPSRFRPVLTSVAILHSLQATAGSDAVWRAPGSRPEFFDALYGTDRVRTALVAGAEPRDIAATWEPGLAAFKHTRAAHMLYR